MTNTKIKELEQQISDLEEMMQSSDISTEMKTDIAPSLAKLKKELESEGKAPAPKPKTSTASKKAYKRKSRVKKGAQGTFENWTTKKIEKGDILLDTDGVLIKFMSRATQNNLNHTVKVSYTGDFEKAKKALHDHYKGVAADSIKGQNGVLTFNTTNIFSKKKVAPKPKPKAVPKKEKPKASTPPKKEAEKPRPKVKSPSQAPTPKSSYTWLQTNDIQGAEPFDFKCKHYRKRVEEDMVVSLKGSGNSTIKVTAKKGEYLIFDDKKHLVFIMEANAAKRKCSEPQKPATIPTKEEPKASEPSPKPNPEKKPTPQSCSAKRIPKGELPVDAEIKIQGLIEGWKAKNSFLKVLKVYAVTLPSGKIDIVIQLKKWRVLGFAKTTNRRICLKSGNLSKNDYGHLNARSSHVNILKSEADVKKMFQGELYSPCRSLIAEAYRCAKDSQCDVKEKGLYKDYYQKCSDKKLTALISKGLREVHGIANQIYEPENDRYISTFKKVLAAIRKMPDGNKVTLVNVRRYMR